MTWGEFAEVRLLSEYRRAGVPMVHMRPAVEMLRDELDVPYPLAHASLRHRFPQADRLVDSQSRRPAIGMVVSTSPAPAGDA